MAAEPRSAKGMFSVLSTLRVLEEVALHQPVGVSELARITGMPKSSVQRCLVTLQEAGWLRQVSRDSSLWTVTAKPLAIGLRAAGEEGLREAALPIMEDLRRTTNETVHLTVRDGDGLLIIARCDSTQPVRTFVEVGTRAPLRATASGVAILAQLDDVEVDELLAGQELVGYTDKSIVEEAKLRKEIAATRRRGYAVNLGGWWRDQVSAIAVAVPGGAGKPVAAIVISVPTLRFNRADIARFGEAGVHAAEEIAHALNA